MTSAPGLECRQVSSHTSCSTPKISVADALRTLHFIQGREHSAPGPDRSHKISGPPPKKRLANSAIAPDASRWLAPLIIQTLTQRVLSHPSRGPSDGAGHPYPRACPPIPTARPRPVCDSYDGEMGRCNGRELSVFWPWPKELHSPRARGTRLSLSQTRAEQSRSVNCTGRHDRQAPNFSTATSRGVRLYVVRATSANPQCREALQAAWESRLGRGPSSTTDHSDGRH